MKLRFWWEWSEIDNGETQIMGDDPTISYVEALKIFLGVDRSIGVIVMIGRIKNEPVV